MPAEQGQKLHFITAENLTVVWLIFTAIMNIIIGEVFSGRRQQQWVVSGPMLTACMICMAMYGNGAGTGTEIIAVITMTREAQIKANSGFYAAVPGVMLIVLCDPLDVAVAVRITEVMSSVFELYVPFIKQRGITV